MPPKGLWLTGRKEGYHMRTEDAGRWLCFGQPPARGGCGTHRVRLRGGRGPGEAGWLALRMRRFHWEQPFLGMVQRMKRYEEEFRPTSCSEPAAQVSRAMRGGQRALPLETARMSTASASSGIRTCSLPSLPEPRMGVPWGCSWLGTSTGAP